MPARPKDYSGERFGRWTAVSFAEWKTRGGGRRTARWLCRCDCGNEAVLTVEQVRTRARSGIDTSCGCARAKHGHAMIRSGTYSSWQNMLARCTHPSNPAFAHYQKRGIDVCDRWRDFAAFLADIGERPEGTTLDRIDNSAGYHPGNVRWATKVQQANNRITNATFEYRGDVYTIAELARATGVSKSLLRTRLVRCKDRKWAVEEAVHAPRMWRGGKLRHQ